MRAETIGAALAACLLAACAQAPQKPAAPELFVVIPAPDGHVGAIAVQHGNDTRVLDTAYGATRIDANGNAQSVKLGEEEVRRDFGTTLAALPGKPATFVLYFLEGRDELTPESKAELDRVFSELKRRPLPDIAVIGHTDSVGALAYNDRLSLARAERVRQMLIALGIPAARVSAAGRGEREPLVVTDDNVAEPRNRRVEINVR